MSTPEGISRNTADGLFCFVSSMPSFFNYFNLLSLALKRISLTMNLESPLLLWRFLYAVLPKVK